MVEEHFLLGIPEQLDASGSSHIIATKGDFITQTIAPELFATAKISEGASSLLQRWSVDGRFTATSLACHL